MPAQLTENGVLRWYVVEHFTPEGETEPDPSVGEHIISGPYDDAAGAEAAIRRAHDAAMRKKVADLRLCEARLAVLDRVPVPWLWTRLDRSARRLDNLANLVEAVPEKLSAAEADSLPPDWFREHDVLYHAAQHAAEAVQALADAVDLDRERVAELRQEVEAYYAEPIPVRCSKCGTRSTIERRQSSRATTEAEMESPYYNIDAHLTCPHCRATRGGSYPLMLAEEDR